MREVSRVGLRAAKHVEGELYEVKADGDRQTFRVLFALEGKHDQVLLSLEAFSKKQRKLPREKIELAKRRLRDWRSRLARHAKTEDRTCLDTMRDIPCVIYQNEEEMMEQDFLSEIIGERTEKNPKFPVLVEAAIARRELLRALAHEREEAGVTQTELAAAMGTSQSQVARLESGGVDTKLSTVEKFAAVLGKKLEWRLVDHV